MNEEAYRRLRECVNEPPVGRRVALGGVAWADPTETDYAHERACEADRARTVERWVPPVSIASIETCSDGTATIVVHGINAETLESDLNDIGITIAEVLFEHSLKVFPR